MQRHVALLRVMHEAADADAEGTEQAVKVFRHIGSNANIAPLYTYKIGAEGSSGTWFFNIWVTGACPSICGRRPRSHRTPCGSINIKLFHLADFDSAIPGYTVEIATALPNIDGRIA